MPPRLRLDWHDHGGELSALTSDLWNRRELSDVTLATEGGRTFAAHKIILASASNYFREVFKSMKR